MKTFTPDLHPAVLERLRDYAALFAPDFPRAKPARWAGVYLHGRLTDGDRKTVEPLSRQVALPDGLAVRDPEQALQQFVRPSPWDEQAGLRRYRSRRAQAFAGPGAALVIDDTMFPKPGQHSVGVQRPYCGARGKEANGQAAVSVHYVAPNGHDPLAVRLFRPESWRADEPRLNRAGGVPGRPDEGSDRVGTARPRAGRGVGRAGGRGRRRVPTRHPGHKIQYKPDADERPAAGVGAPAGRPAEAAPRPARPAPRPAPRGQRPQGGRP